MHMKKYISIALAALIACSLGACSDDEEKLTDDTEQQVPQQPAEDEEGKDDEEEVKPEEPVVSITPIAQLNQGESVLNSHAALTARSSVKMNYRTYTEVNKTALVEPNQQYPRIKKMANGNYIMFYQKGSSKSSGIGQRCHWALSTDLAHWTHQGDVFTSRTVTDSQGKQVKRYYANCDGVVLKNGDILAVASFRGDNYKVNQQYDGVELRRSTDNGRTWGEYQVIYQGGITWEPYIIELPSGEIHCYFTDSSRTGLEGHGQDTGTAMVVSHDGGQTWEPTPSDTPYNPYYVLRMKWEANGITGFNHQMPCVICLNETNELAAAMESHPQGKDYHISLAYSGEDGQWDYLEADQEGPADSENMQFLGSAPYLIQFPSGETLLSYNRGGYHLKMGDARARNFEEESYDPFQGSFWGSLCLIDNHRAACTIPHESDESIIVAQVVLNHAIRATQREVIADGDNKEWQPTDDALFIGDRTQAQATLRASCDDKNVYFLVEVLDQNPVPSSSDYMSTYIAPVTPDDQLTAEAFRINVYTKGLIDIETYRNGAWTETDGKNGIMADATLCTRDELDDTEKGYIVEIAVPRTEMPITDGEVLLNFSMTKNYGEQDALQKGSLPHTQKWVPLTGLAANMQE